MGTWIVIGAIVVALAFGGYRKLTDGRARKGHVEGPAVSHLMPAGLGQTATFLQFSSPTCAPCRATERVLSQLAEDHPGVAHIEIDVTDNMELADAFSVTRTPTVFLLDSAGEITAQFVGPSRKQELVSALTELAPAEQDALQR